MEFLIVNSLLHLVGFGDNLPTLYEHYTDGGISSGLETVGVEFKLNGKDITLYGGAIHYFRVHPKYWRDRLRKARAAGLNFVETYIPWNLHEPEEGMFDFGDGNRDMSIFLNVRQFIQLAQEEDLLVIIRPGPYICSEWEFGGLPSWLLASPDIKVRTSDPKFTSRVKSYFDQLIPLLSDLQFILGGSIIAIQVENEYGNFGEQNTPKDKKYLEFVKQSYIENGLIGLFVTCDTPAFVGDTGSLPEVLQTATFNKNPEKQLEALKKLQPDRPLMVMEYWSGWYDHWLDDSHQTGLTLKEFEDNLEVILNYNSSVNIYMLHGGTSFGFMNGADPLSSSPFYQFDATSYDYDAPISEAGDYNEKYAILEKTVAKYNPVKTRLPDKPEESKKFAYPSVNMTEFLNFEDILAKIDANNKVKSSDVMSMELLNINQGSGQSYGYINYQTKINLTKNSSLTIKGHVRDTVMLLLDGVQRTKIITGPSDLTGFGYWVSSDTEFHFDEADAGSHTLDLLVENWGRCNYGYPENFLQQKGLWEGPVSIDSVDVKDWDITAIELKSDWIKRLNGWRSVENSSLETGPFLLKGELEISDEPGDTWINMSQWGKGVVFINGFNIGRYLYLGPPVSLFIPAPILQKGTNKIIVFEQYHPASAVSFSDKPIFVKQ
ncbi:beta-galactosidase-1-like protein 2 isoform X2 [Ischnura elegans]|uniref:beta-galactosidase-1-like protein 2 isoform X2 n=1 Tax=Ischnura elegans TaxID=197161 RepID=UPI001ED86E9D|nr:beta-galactosidase-1-like protein 2 isoform X2 [Ischnura elegans]